MAFGGVGPRQGRVRELIELFNQEVELKGGVAKGRGASSPSRSPSVGSLGSAMMDIVEVPNDASMDLRGSEARSPLAGLKRPSNTDSIASMSSLERPLKGGAKNESIGTQTMVSSETQTEAGSLKETSDSENKPLKGLDAFTKCFVGDNGIKAGALKFADGDIAAGLRDIFTSIVMAPIHLVSMVMDGPRKIGDMASIKGQELIDANKGQLGAKAVFKHLAGGLLQITGAVVRLGFPLVGGAAVLFATGPVGMGVGLAILGLYALKDVAALVNKGPDQMQTVRALRDLVSGTFATLGTVIEGVLVKPAQYLFKKNSAPQAALEPDLSVASEEREDRSVEDPE